MRRADRPGRSPPPGGAHLERNPAPIALDAERSPEVSAPHAEVGAAAEAVQERLGNAWLAGALDAGATDAFSAMVVGEMGLAVAGLAPTGGFVAAGNQAVLASMRAGEGDVQAGDHVARALASTGAPLPSGVLARMETALGHEFGGVRVHLGVEADKAAREIQARAFAVGRDLFFASGEFSPGGAAGDEILAHELTHVIQHDEGRLAGKSGVSNPHDVEEREADANAARAVALLSGGNESIAGATDNGAHLEGADGSDLGGVGGAQVGGADAGPASEDVAAAGLVARKEAPGGPNPPPKADTTKADPAKTDPKAVGAVPVPTAGKSAPLGVKTPGADGKNGATSPAPGGVAGATDTQNRSLKDLAATAVAKVPKVVQSASTNLKQAEKKLPDDPSAVRSKLPDLLKAKFKPVVEPLVPHRPGEALSLDALVGVVSAMVTALPEVVKHAGVDAEADAKEAKKAKPDAGGKTAPAGQQTPSAPTAPGTPATGPTQVTPHEPAKDAGKGDAGKGDANKGDASKGDDTTQFFVTAIAEALAALCPVQAPAPGDEAKDVVVAVTLAPVGLTAGPATKDAKDTKKPDDPKAAKEEKNQKKQELQWEIERLKIDEEYTTRTRDGLAVKVDAAESRINATRSEMDARRAYLEHRAAVAKKAGKKTQPLTKDGRLRLLEHEAEEIPKEVERLRVEMASVEKQLAEVAEKRQKSQEALDAINAELAAAARGSGGVHMPPPTDLVETSKAVLKALEPKEKKLKTEAEKAKTDCQKLKDGIATLEANVKKGTDDLAALQKKKEGYVADERRLEGLVKSRTAVLNTPGADGAPAPGTAGDAALEGYRAGIDKAIANRREVNKQITELSKQLRAWNDELKPKRIALEEAEEKKTTTENAVTNFATAVTSLKDPLGNPNWQMVVGDYKLGVKAVPLPAGMVRDESGALVKEADLKKKEEGPPKTKAEKDKEEADRSKAKAEADAEEAKLSKADRDKRDAEKKKKKEQEFLQAMSAAKDLPKAEREVRLKEIAEAQGKKVPEIQAQYATQMGAMAKAIKPGMTKKEAADAGLTTQFDLLKAQTDRTAREEKAKALLGTASGEDAVDTLWKHARGRGLANPDEMLKHLAHANPDSLPESLKAAALTCRAAENARIAALKNPSTELDKAKDEQSKAQAAARDAETRFTKNKDLGLRLKCSPEEAALYVKALAGSVGAGGSAEEDAAREALMQQDPRKTVAPGDMNAKLKEVNAKLKEIHLLPIGPKRQEELMKLAKATGDPKILLGAALVPEAGDGALIKGDGKVASPLLKSQLDAIDKLPPDKQWDAMCNLSRLTNQSPNDLARARQNLAKKNDVVRKVTDIEKDESLSPAKKQELITEIATTHKMDVDKIRDYARTERNKTAETIELACKNDPDLQKQLDALKLDSKKSPDEMKLALKDIARRTGLDPAALEDWNNMFQFRQKRARWKEQFKSGSDDEAAAKMASLIDQYGSSDAAKEHLRNCPRANLPTEMQRLKDDLEKWDRANPGTEVAAKLKRVDVHAPGYKKRRDALISELNSTVYVSDSKALKLLSPPNLSKEELAALMEEKPWIFKKFYKGVDGDTSEGKKAAELFGAAKAHQLQLDKETADDAAKGAKAAAFEAQVQTARLAALALGQPLKEARANLQAIADGNGMSPEQALVWLKSQPGKTPAQALSAAYAEVPGKDSKEKVNPVLRARLEQIDLLPARDRSEALKGLKGMSGIGDYAMDKALTETRRDSNITADLHALRDLPKSEREAALKDLAKKHNLKDTAQLESIYRNSLERTAIRMSAVGLGDDDILPKGLSLAPEDMAKHVKELARKTGQSEESIRRIVEARRSAGFGEESAKMLGGEDKAEAFKKAAADINLTPSQYADWLARSPASMLDDTQRALKKQMQDNGNKPVRSEAERKEMDKALGADPTDLDYRKKAAALTAQLQSGHEDADILAKFGGMTPGQQKLFKEEYEKETGKRLAERFDNSLQGKDEDRGRRMLAAANVYDPARDAEAAFAAVDPADQNFKSRMENLQKELAKGSDANAGKVGQMLIEMPLNQRAQFLREYEQAQQLAPQGVDMTDGKRQKYLPISLKQLLEKDKEALGALNQGLSLKGATTPVKDADRAQRVQESITIGREAAAALDVDQRTAFRLVDGLARDSGMSPSNALLFLQGKEIKPEADKRSPFVKAMCDDVARRALAANPAKLMQSMINKNGDKGEKINGQTLNDQKVENTRNFFASGKPKSDAAIVAMIQGCNPRELAELDKKLQAGDPPRTLADVTKGVTGKDKKELGPMLRGMQDYKDTESHYKLIRTVKDQDPRKEANVATPEGFAEKLQWCKDLPPEDRLRELNKLRAEAGGVGDKHFGAKQVMAAWLNGPQGVGTNANEPHMLSSAMSAELDAIERLPSQAARDEALKKLAVLTGRWNTTGGLDETERELKKARVHTAQGMQVGKRMQEIEELPADQRQQAVLDLSKSANLSIDALHGLHQESLKSGLVVAGIKTVTPEQARQLALIRGLPAKEQGPAIKKFETDSGLDPRDINAHLQTDLEATQKKMAERNRAQQGADALKDKMVAGDTAGVKKQLEDATSDPAELKRILDAYGPGLDKDLVVLFGDRKVAAMSPTAYLLAGDSLGKRAAEGDIDYRILVELVKNGKDFEQAPELPSGVSPLVSDEVRRIRMNMPPEQWDDEFATLRAQKGISEEDFAIVIKNAEVNQRQFEKTVASKMKLLEVERSDKHWYSYVSDSNVAQICKGMSPEVMAEINKRNPKLVENIRGGLDGNIQDDFTYTLNLGNKLQDLPQDAHQKVITEARVDHKATQLQEEFDSWFEDKGRIKELLKDCSAEELKSLNDRFGGRLQEKIDKANETSIWGKVGLGLGLGILALVAGPIALAVGGVAVAGGSCDEKDPEWMAIKMRLRDATCDPKAPFDPAANKAARDSVKKTLESEFNSWWTRDSTCLSAIKSLSPRDLAELQKEYNAEHGEGALEAALRQGVSGDHLVKSIALLRDAEDAAAGIDRGQQMKDTIRQMAVKEVMAELKKDPRNKQKTDSELYEMAEKDESKVAEKAKEKQKKISEGANSIFKAVDGWGDDESAVQKTLAGLSLEEIELVKIEYRRHFGRDLDTHLNEDIGGKDLEVMQKLMKKETRVEGLQKYILTMSGIDEETEAYATSYGGFGEDEEGIYAAFQAMSPEERTKVCAGPGGEKFLARVKLNLGSNEAAVVDALTEINPETGVAEANPAHVAASKIQLYTKGSGDWDFWSGWGTKEEELVKELDKLTPAEVQECARWYENKYGETLAGVLADELGTDSREFAVVDAEMRGDKVEADVHRLKWAAQDENSSSNWLLAATGPLGAMAAGGLSAAGVSLPVLFSGTDEELLEATLKGGKEKRGGRDAEHLEKVKARFNKMFGEGDLGMNDGTGRSPIDRLIDNETSGVEKAYFTQLAAKGEADPEVELFYSMDGLGTDEERAKKVMERVYDMSSDERAAFKHRFATVGQSMYGSTQSLDEWISSDFSGTEGFEMKLQLRGKPEKPEDFLEIARMRWEFERGEGNGFMNSFMDGLESLGATSAGEVFANDTARLYAMFDEKGHLRADVPREKLEEIAGWQGQTAKNYRETRDSITDAVVNTVQVVGAVVIAVIPGLQGVSAMIIANIVLAAATMALKAAMKGNGFGWEEGLMDLAMAAVSVATAGMGGKLNAAGSIAMKEGQIVAGKIGAFAMKLAEKFGGKVGAAKMISSMITEAIQNGTQGLLNAALTSEDAYRKGDGAFFKHILGGAIGGAVQGAAVSGLKGGIGHTGIGKAIEEAKAVGSSAGIATKMAAHFADGLISSTLQTATDFNQWEQWAAGKGIDAATLRGAFLQGLAQSVMGTAFEGAIKKQHIDMAHQEIHTATTRLGDIHTALQMDMPHTERVKLQAEHTELTHHIAEQKNVIVRMQDVVETQDKQQKARDEIEQKIDQPTAKKDADPQVDAARNDALKQALKQTDNGTGSHEDVAAVKEKPQLLLGPATEKPQLLLGPATEKPQLLLGPGPTVHGDAERHAPIGHGTSEVAATAHKTASTSELGHSRVADTAEPVSTHAALGKTQTEPVSTHVSPQGGEPVATHKEPVSLPAHGESVATHGRPVSDATQGQPVSAHGHEPSWNGWEPASIAQMDRVSGSFAALDKSGQVYDLRDLKWHEGAWKTSAGATVPPEVGAQANERRKVELHQHFRGIVPSDELAAMLGESALRVRAEGERVLAAGGTLTPEQLLVKECFKPGQDPAVSAMKWLERSYDTNTDSLKSNDQARARREAVAELHERVRALDAELKTAPDTQVRRIVDELSAANDQLEAHRLQGQVADKAAALRGANPGNQAQKAADLLSAQGALDAHAAVNPEAVMAASDPGHGPLKRQMEDPKLHGVDHEGSLTPTSARAQLDALLSAGHDNPYDATYDPRGLLIAAITGSRDLTGAKVGGADPARGEEFLRATLAHLRRDGIDYAEPQGNWHKDLGLKPADMVRIGQEEGVELRFLPHRVSENELALNRVPDSKKESYQKELSASLRAGAAPSGGEFHAVAAGFDFCGPEGKPFQPEGMKHLTWAYEVLAGAAAESGKRMVLRPHVGEGYTETYEQRVRGVSGAGQGGTDYRNLPAGANAHPSDIARHNLQMVIDTVSALKDAGLYTPGGPVAIRLGHVTNIDPAQAAQLKSLGIIAEVNLGSNVSTGALKRMDGGESRLTGHPMLDLLAAEVPTVLSTDAHAVMHTDLRSEFKSAGFLLDQFREGKATVTYEGKTQTYDQMVASIGKDRTDHMFSVDRLHEAAQDYRAGVHTPLADGGAATPGTPRLGPDAPDVGAGTASHEPAEPGTRTVSTVQRQREAALGPEWSAGIEDAKRGMTASPADSLAHEGFRNRLIDLERISRLHDPAQAQVEFATIKANDLAATERPTHHANPTDVRAAQRTLAANPEAEIPPHQAMALLDSALGTTRAFHMADTGLDSDAAHAPVNLAGAAAPAQRRVAEALGAMGVTADRLTFHNGGEGGQFAPASAGGDHAFTVARMPDGRLYLIDPAFGQHLATGHDSMGRRLVSDPHGAVVAHVLATDGYVLLDDATARAYGKALTGRDTAFSAADFARPNGIAVHGGAETVSPDAHATRNREYDAGLRERRSGDAHAVAKEALGMHHSEWAADPDAQRALFDSSAHAVTRMKAEGADIVRGMEGAEVSSLRKRDDFGEFVTEVNKKQKAEGYEHVGKMCDIVRGRFNLATGADVDLVVARLQEKFGADVVKVKAPRDGYPRWHINVRDSATGLVHEWQIGTKATTDFFETKSLSIPKSITGFTGKPDFHDGVYKLLNKVTDPEIRAKHGIDEMLPEYKKLAEATGKVSKDTPLPERYAERYAEMTKAINEKLVAIETENPGYMNKVLGGEHAAPARPAEGARSAVADSGSPTTKVAETPAHALTPTPVSAGASPSALAHAIVPPAPAVVAPTPAAPAQPIGVRGFLAERDKLGRMAYGSAFQYDVHDTAGVTETRIKVHMKGGASTDPAHVAAWKTHFTGMTDAQVAQMAIAEGNHSGWAPGTPSGAAGIEMARRRMIQGVDQYFNAPGFQVTGPDGKPSRLRVAIEFVDDPALAHHTMNVENGGELGQAYSDRVQSFTSPMIHAHEAGHAIFGLLDEYADHKPAGGSQSNKPEGRRHKNDSRIAIDKSLYAGDVRGSDPATGREIADPATGLRDRHIQQIRDQIDAARTIASRGWTPDQLDALMKGPAQHDEWQTRRMAPTEFHDAGSVNARRLRIAEKMTPDGYAQAMANGWNNAELQSGQIRQIAAKMTAGEYAAARGAGWKNRDLAKADATTLFDAGTGKSRAEIKAEVKAARAPDSGTPRLATTVDGGAGPAVGATAKAPASPAAGVSSQHALTMHHSEFEGHVDAQRALFDASQHAVGRMKAAGDDIVQGMAGAEVSSLRKRDTFDSFVTEVVKKQKSEGYEHVGKMCDIVRGRFNVETGADVQTVVARLKEKFGDDVVKVKEPRDGYPRWHINVRDAETGLVHEWQVGTKGTTQFFETKSLAIPESITAFKGQPDFHDGVYKLLNKVTDPEVRSRHGIDEMLPEYKKLAEETGKVTAEHPVPERYAERYAEMTKAINEKLTAIERDNPGYMNAVLKGEPTPTPTKPEAVAVGPAAARPASPSAKTMAGSPGGEVAAMNEFEGRVLVQYKNGAMQWMEKAQAAHLRVAAATPGVPVSGPNDRTIPPVGGGVTPAGGNRAGAKTLPMTPQVDAAPQGQQQHQQVQRHVQQEVHQPQVRQPVHQPQVQQQQAQQQHAQQQQVHQQQGGQPQVHQQRAGSPWAAQGQRVYANGSNTEFVHVDLQSDPALRRTLDRAHGATAAGGSLDQKLALLAAHVKDDIRYDMAAQQNQYQAQGGQVSLGQMIEQGSVVCREKALFTHAALAEMGIASKVVVGTVPDGKGATGGHAWVELADGTIIDGTWGRIFPAGNDPVQGRTRRSATTFAEPRVELQGAQAISASRGAAAILSNPQEMDRMRRPAQQSPEDLLVRPGVRAWHPDGRSPVTVEYSERHKVQVRHDDGRVEILDRAAFVGGNAWALGQQGGGQQGGGQGQGGGQANQGGGRRHTQTMAAFQPHPDIDAAGPDDKALKLMDARARNHDLDRAVHDEVQTKTRQTSGGHGYVDETFDNVTVGAGFAGISNEVGQRATGKGGKRLVIGEENPWLKAKADLGQPAGESEVHGGQHGMKQTAQSADERFMQAREHAENAEINRANSGVGLFKKKIIGVELRPEPMDGDWHRPDAKARIAVIEGHAHDGSPIIRYVYAKRVDIASGPGPARRLADKAMIRGRGPVPDNMDPAEFSRLASEGKIVPRQIDPELYRQLLAEKRILQSDQAFDPANVDHGDHVLVYGSGASAAWGVEGSLAKAGKVDWLGRMAKPGDDLTTSQNNRLKQHYVELEAAHASGDALAAERHMREIEHFTFTEAPNNGFLPRNLRDGGAFDPEQQAEHGGKITRDVLPDVASVTREAHPETGKTMIRVEGADGSVRWCDRLVLAIGQDGAAAGGPGKLLDKVPVLRPLVDPSASDWGFPVVVGLQTPDSSVRVLGVAATSPVLRHKIESGSREFVEQSFALQAGDKSTVPLDSQGVIGSFHHAERMIRAANKDQLVDLASHSPEDQADILGVHHGKWQKKRAEDNLRTKDAPEMPQPQAK